MPNEINPHELQRLQFRPDQLLSSRDLNDQMHDDAERRAWHNRALHNAYGIAASSPLGFQVWLGAGQAIIGPGLAYDSAGRELLNDDYLRIPFPEDLPPGELALIVRLRRPDETCGIPQAPIQMETCLPGSRERENALEFAWLPVETADPRLGVILGTANLEKEKGELHHTRQHSAALSRPRLVSGATLPGAGWELWRLESDQLRESAILGLQVNVDISAAGFNRQPCVFASLQARGLSNKDKISNKFFLLGLEHIEDLTARSFTFRLALIGQFTTVRSPVEALEEFVRQIRPFVSWIAVEPAPAIQEERSERLDEILRRELQ